MAVGCGGSSVPEPTHPDPKPLKTGEAAEVPFPPPPARVEFIPDKPRAGAVWVDGEWSWTGRRWAWTYGKWVLPPADATFAPWKTVRSNDGTLLFVAGIWHDEKGAEIPDPEPLAVGRAREENVVLPPGQTEKTAPNQVPGVSPKAP
ncbi:MAG TPA: YXWGXW repeat-containing protein [Polyangiaceae bacterium]|nr:YXWGXW repeat-containing protein [Polyangiaceae bacterium]